MSRAVRPGADRPRADADRRMKFVADRNGAPFGACVARRAVLPPPPHPAARGRIRRHPTRHEGTWWRAGLQPAARLAEDFVSALVSEAVVGVLEIVEIDKQDRRRRGDWNGAQHRIDELVETVAVGQAREAVVRRAPNHLLLARASGEGDRQPIAKLGRGLEDVGAVFRGQAETQDSLRPGIPSQGEQRTEARRARGRPRRKSSSESGRTRRPPCFKPGRALVSRFRAGWESRRPRANSCAAPWSSTVVGPRWWARRGADTDLPRDAFERRAIVVPERTSDRSSPGLRGIGTDGLSAPHHVKEFSIAANSSDPKFALGCRLARRDPLCALVRFLRAARECLI